MHVLSANAEIRNGVLKINPKPKMLQGWQAYQVLTYEQQWKAHVDKEWEKYKMEWEVEHPNEKPPKKRIQIMSDFMKEKYENETDEMKVHCEKYRWARKENPDVNESDATRNLQFQLYIYICIFARNTNLNFPRAIDKLPQTFATFSDSIMKQTGWNVTIMAGGPSPENDGMIMTFLWA